VKIAVALALLLSCTPTALLDFAIPKWKTDHAVHIEDAYKWIYQATRGGEHAAPDREMARQWLESEWSALGKPEKDEPLWEPLCKDESIGRFNLRVFRLKGGKMDVVLEAFVTSSREFKESGTSFVDTWLQLGERLRTHPVNVVTYHEWTRLDNEMKPKKYPPLHHSKSYEDKQHPAYRVLTGTQFRTIRRDLK
jgi:hypothetical protein